MKLPIRYQLPQPGDGWLLAISAKKSELEYIVKSLEAAGAKDVMAVPYEDTVSDRYAVFYKGSLQEKILQELLWN